MKDFIIDEFYKKMKNVNLNCYGVIDQNDKIHTLGTDSKIIGRIFEMLSQPILEEIAKEHNMTLETPKSQTVYPDFILMDSKDSKNKIAIDIKTTYISKDGATIKFALGSYKSYLRDNKKNIEYTYMDYSKHYVIGFIYKRNDLAQESKVYNFSERTKVTCPYIDVKYFIQEKYKIAGEKTGSGNTENIGSFSTKKFTDLKNGLGPFNELGKDIFELYWKYYPIYRSTEKTYTSLSEFIEWFPKQEKNNVTLLHPYDYDKVIENLLKFKEKHY